VSRSRARLRLPAIAFHPALWLAAFLLWFGTLWWLSSAARPLHHPPPVPLSDKILHFGWFFGGAGLLCAFLYRLRPQSRRPLASASFAAIVLVATGVLDEWHQSRVPGRQGNDPADLAADIAGSIAGILCFRRFGWRALTPDHQA
jgi:VanZ family protein